MNQLHRTALQRRALLGLGAAAGAAVALAACGREPDSRGEAGPTPSRPISSADTGSLQAQIRGRVLMPGDPGYAEESSPFNLTVSHRPAVVVAAAEAADVQAAVRFAADRDLPVGVMATGHQNSVTIDGGLLLSTRAMRAADVDAGRRTARVAAGTLWGQAVQAATGKGLAPLTGSSPTVGVVGYTVGGGLSPTFGRMRGYAADHVTSLDLVTADGRLRKVTAQTEPELFFAARGGKSNFGIVTAMEFGLFPIRSLYAGTLFFAADRAADVLTKWRDWTTTVPEEMSSSVALLRVPPVPGAPEPLRGKLVVAVRISFVGPAKTGADLVRPLRSAGVKLLDTVAEMPYAGFAAIHADPTEPLPAYERTALLDRLPDDAIAQILAAAGPDAPVPLTMTEVRHLGGALGRQAKEPNAVSNREAAYTLFTAAVGAPEQAAAIRSQQDQLIRRLAPWGSGRTYINFLSVDEGSPEQVKTAFTPGTFARLTRVKQQVDPTNMFRLNHNIAPVR